MTSKPRSLWILQPKPLRSPRLRLVCFPFAGAGASAYFKWCDEFGRSGVEVCAVQLPGRESRFEEPLETNMLRISSSLVSEFNKFLEKPFALFGHSMGSILAFETARALRNTHGVEPVHLFASGRVAPHMESKNWWSRKIFSDNEFISELCAQYGPMMPDAILKDGELLEIYVRIIRADLSLLDTYRYVPDCALSCPVSAFSGDQDLRVCRSGLDAWREMTTGMFSSIVMPGGHFFINTFRAELIGAITKLLLGEITK